VLITKYRGGQGVRRGEEGPCRHHRDSGGDGQHDGRGKTGAGHEDDPGDVHLGEDPFALGDGAAFAAGAAEVVAVPGSGHTHPGVVGTAEVEAGQAGVAGAAVVEVEHAEVEVGAGQAGVAGAGHAGVGAGAGRARAQDADLPLALALALALA